MFADIRYTKETHRHDSTWKERVTKKQDLKAPHTELHMQVAIIMIINVMHMCE